MESGIQLGLGGGAHQKWIQCPNPTSTIGLVSSTLAHACALLCAFCSQLYSRQLMVTCILMYRGAESHRAHTCCPCSYVVEQNWITLIPERQLRLLLPLKSIVAYRSNAEQYSLYLPRNLGLVMPEHKAVSEPTLLWAAKGDPRPHEIEG